MFLRIIGAGPFEIKKEHPKVPFLWIKTIILVLKFKNYWTIFPVSFISSF